MLRDYSENKLTCKVREYLRTKFEVEYTGKFHCIFGTEDNPNFYALEWIANQQDRPMVILGEFENIDDFFKYICKEIRERKFFKKKVFIVKQSDKNGNT